MHLPHLPQHCPICCPLRRELLHELSLGYYPLLDEQLSQSVLGIVHI